MTVEVWRNGDGLFHVIQGDETLPEWLLEDNPEFCYIVEGDDWNECMEKHFAIQGW